jgi:hypothetical protein
MFHNKEWMMNKNYPSQIQNDYILWNKIWTTSMWYKPLKKEVENKYLISSFGLSISFFPNWLVHVHRMSSARNQILQKWVVPAQQ